MPTSLFITIYRFLQAMVVPAAELWRINSLRRSDNDGGGKKDNNSGKKLLLRVKR
jgi:hypothetical protein